MRIHGHGYCDICLPNDVQEQVLEEGKALSHRWAPEKDYLKCIARNEETLDSTMELIRLFCRWAKILRTEGARTVESEQLTSVLQMLRFQPRATRQHELN